LLVAAREVTADAKETVAAEAMAKNVPRFIDKG
jgi:hypothetical protein